MARYDINIVDLLDDCGSGEIADIIKWVDMHYPETLKEFMSDTENSITLPTEQFIQDEIWNESVIKLLKNRMGLSKEEEDLVINLSNKFI